MSNGNKNLLEVVDDESLPLNVLTELKRIATERDFLNYNITKYSISGIGENSYGLVLRVQLTSIDSRNKPIPTFHCIIKIAPKHSARREHMKVAEYYAREVFMYENVLSAYRKLYNTHIQSKDNQSESELFAPEMYGYSLNNLNEFIILEDLGQQHFKQNARLSMPNYDLVTSALQTLAKMHAMSFVLAAKEPETFASIINQLKDNLFTTDIDEVSIEFGKKYVRRTYHLLRDNEDEENTDENENVVIKDRQLQLLQTIEHNLKSICLSAVNGRACAPYAVINHGDFWNNNILYKETENSSTITAKLVDFQMSRYASPVLDIVHYLFACTEQSLRNAHFCEFLELYYTSLIQHIKRYDLDPVVLYPREIFDKQLQKYGVYGFCMSAFSLPFFISNTTEIPDLDEVSQIIEQTSKNEDTTTETDSNKYRDLVDEWDLLNTRTEPIFMQRMTGIVSDLFLYGMDNVL